MTATQFEDAKLMMKMQYANNCFSAAKAGAQIILDNQLETDCDLFYPLMTGVFVLYARPFTNSNAVGRLGLEIIPPEHLEFHQVLMQNRHQIYAHTDGNSFHVGKLGPVNQVRAIRTLEGVTFVSTDCHARHPQMPRLIELCKILVEKTNYHQHRLHNKYVDLVPIQPGEYILNVTDQAGSMWIMQDRILPKGMEVDKDVVIRLVPSQ